MYMYISNNLITHAYIHVHVPYLFQDTHLRRDNLKPFTSYEVFLQYYNLYTLLFGNNLDITILLWLDGVMDGVMTEPGG